MADAPGIAAVHVRRFDRYQVMYHWQHYIPLVQRKPGALRNGAPFAGMPEPFLQLQRYLLKREGGDRVMAEVLSVIPEHGVEARPLLDVLQAAEGYCRLYPLRRPRVEPRDQPHPQPNRPLASMAPLQDMVSATVIHADRPHLNPMAAYILYKLGR